MPKKKLKMNIAETLEHTNLNPLATDQDIEKLVQEALDFDLFGVCVPAYWVKKAKRDIGQKPLILVTVAGFPLGYQRTEAKLKEIELALKDGADEIDFVMNLSAFASGTTNWVKAEFAQCSKMVHEAEKIVKVILETAYLDAQQIAFACQLAQDAGIDFVKTSTGFAHRGASIEDIKIMKASISPSMGIKASGGIKNYAQALQFIEAGAERIGTSSGIKICLEAKKELL